MNQEAHLNEGVSFPVNLKCETRQYLGSTSSNIIVSCPLLAQYKSSAKAFFLLNKDLSLNTCICNITTIQRKLKDRLCPGYYMHHHRALLESGMVLLLRYLANARKRAPLTNLAQSMHASTYFGRRKQESTDNGLGSYQPVFLNLYIFYPFLVSFNNLKEIRNVTLC